MNIISQIASGAVTLWREVEADIEADAAKVKAALPASTIPTFDADVSTLKQGASDALSTAGTSLAGVAPDLASGIESLLDTAAVTLTNGAAAQLVPLMNMGYEQLESFVVSVVKAKVLKLKATSAVPAAA